MNPTRRLAAILAADVAGYSRLIGTDEQGTLNRLRSIRTDVVDPKITEHHGRLVKTTGDGLLVEFGSVVDALRCALEALRRLTLIVAGLIVGAVSAQAQETVHRIGFFANAEYPELEHAFLDGLRDAGYLAGRNLQIEFRYTQGEPERIPPLLTELVALHPEIIVAIGPPNAIAVRNSAPAIPLVFIAVADPVAVGLVQSLAHPGGNVTGFATLVPEDFVAKQLQLLKAAVPTASRIAILVNPTNQIHQREQTKFSETTRRLGIELFPVEARKLDQLGTAFEAAHMKRADAIHVFGDPLFNREGPRIVELAMRYRLPSSYLYRANVVQGGLIAYGSNPLDYYRGAAPYVDKILKGAKPGDLPVAQPTRFDLTINLKTARELGIPIPPDLLAQAAETIE